VVMFSQFICKLFTVMDRNLRKRDDQMGNNNIVWIAKLGLCTSNRVSMNRVSILILGPKPLQGKAELKLGGRILWTYNSFYLGHKRKFPTIPR
jgi:hypothetical protein